MSMRADFSRSIIDPILRFVGVQNQQGAVKADSDQAQPAPAARWLGIFRGVVGNVDDPLTRLRVAVSVPGVAGVVDLWAEACIAPNSRSVPAIGDGVWVMFENGAPDRPVWLGVMGQAA
jgi:hypothetical protein